MDLLPGQSLKSWMEGEGDGFNHLTSATGAFRLTMQSDGNLVLRALDDTNYPFQVNYTEVVWSSGTGNQFGNSAHCDMQATDGNLVVYNAFNTPVWASNTQGNKGAFLRPQDDGNLVVYASDGRVLWASHTEARE